MSFGAKALEEIYNEIDTMTDEEFNAILEIAKTEAFFVTPENPYAFEPAEQ